MITRQEAQAKFNEYHETQGSHDEFYTDGSNMNERVGVAAVINRHFLDCGTICRQLSKILSDNSTIFAAEATALTLALNYYQYMGTVHHDVVVYSDPMSCLRAIAGKDTENLFIAIQWTSHGYWATKAHVLNCSFLLDTEPLWHRGKWSASKRDPWPRHKPTSKCPPCRFEAMGLLPDTKNCGLRMRRECRERFPLPPISKKTAC